ncbi:MAG: GDYXXLXY domain-containing protein [Turneriella sp.]|nr:GDYXXLXY domain-containing protein [Turneriella sp.]
MKNRLPLPLMLGLPWLILIGMVSSAYLPILTGKEYLLPVRLKDPRDFFRGNYVALQYSFSELALDSIRHDLQEGKYRHGDVLYLEFLEKDGVLHPTGLFRTKRPTGIWLKVRPENEFHWPEAKSIRLRAGLDSFFAPPSDARAWEDAIQEGRVYARVAIDRDGNARLLGLNRK